MKVLLINDRQIGGGAEIVYQQTYRLLQQCSAILNVKKSTPYGGRLNSLVNLFGIINVPYSIYLIWKIVSCRPNIIHIHNYVYVVSPFCLIVLAFLKIIVRFRVVHTAHDFHLVCPNTGFVRYLASGQPESCCRCAEDGNWSNVVKFNCDRRGIAFSMMRYLRHQVCYRWLNLHRVIDTIICPSEFLANKLRRTYPNNCILVLRNPAFLDCSNDNLPKMKNVNFKILGYFGRLAPEKGIYQFIDDNYDVSEYPRFLIYGEGVENKRIKQLIEDKGLVNNVRLMGAVSHTEMSHAMRSVDVVVLPSICHENCPLVVCDALKLGKEVISFSPGGVAELLAARQNGNTKFLNITAYQEGLLAIYREETASLCISK